jgi:hypothetical protein
MVSRIDATPPPVPLQKEPGRLINHRRKRGKNISPFVFAINNVPRIFFKVQVNSIPPGKQICYDYQDLRNYAPGDKLGWLKNINESSDDEGKLFKISHFNSYIFNVIIHLF